MAVPSFKLTNFACGEAVKEIDIIAREVGTSLVKIETFSSSSPDNTEKCLFTQTKHELIFGTARSPSVWL